MQTKDTLHKNDWLLAAGQAKNWIKIDVSRQKVCDERMKTLDQFQNKKIEILFTDIDDTITDHGELRAEAYSAMWKLKNAGIKIVPITGRPAGWCEMIARFWPVDGVVGENGGFYFRYKDKHMHRHFVVDEKTLAGYREKLRTISEKVLREVPGCAIASDQFSRLMDVAIDFSEDVPALDKASVQKIVQIFEAAGATAKVSSIHVNAWFGTYDKLSMCKEFVKREYGWDLGQNLSRVAFSGDSPNDEPMFSYFENSFAVANIKNFLDQIKAPPKYVASLTGGQGFVQIAECLLKQ